MISLENWKISTTLQKLTKMWALGQNNCCHRLWKVAQSSIYCPIWSHCNRQVVVVVMHQKFVLQNTIVCLFVCLPSIQFKKINKQDRSIGKRKYFLGHTFFSVQNGFFRRNKKCLFFSFVATFWANFIAREKCQKYLLKLPEAGRQIFELFLFLNQTKQKN